MHYSLILFLLEDRFYLLLQMISSYTKLHGTEGGKHTSASAELLPNAVLISDTFHC